MMIKCLENLLGKNSWIKYGLPATLLSLAVILITAHQPIAIPFFGFLLGLAQWSDFRRMGYSEGVDIAAQLAHEEERVSAAALLGGGGYNAADEIRLGLHQSLQTSSAALDPVLQRGIDAYIWRKSRKILADPSPDRQLLGLSFRRWASYILSHPINDLLAARQTRFLSIHGEKDRNLPVEAAQYIEDVFRIKERENHLLIIKNDLDHSFRDASGQNHLPEVLGQATQWILEGS